MPAVSYRLEPFAANHKRVTAIVAAIDADEGGAEVTKPQQLDQVSETTQAAQLA